MPFGSSIRLVNISPDGQLFHLGSLIEVNLMERLTGVAGFPRLHRARRSLRRVKDIAARATARVRAQGAVARPRRGFGSSAPLPPAATRVGAGPPRSEHP